ncbi:amino acid ABC transporter permease [Caballeronia sp. LP006]|uniref:amino acid ABC transporter permease n=1 Tax=unclassified Caballeronia TaxID=2646786 RepID=UPI001FD0FE92|nr:MULTISPECIES: amino acid ABC transporter permease [unclassified Caballeronia]MDR5774213.1 amino acid ABC transporter permease [Caballeronia sp. LZ002]MDR5805746.1 amino acid ABC transporter permease [Caballeronia sp. LZ001]MDR5826990.1 amino acid ABC transporter permease [Caballeronia sp. LP006]MDR5849648.1 amino acid ABC transporter permease [Caballeronia sp. LZ003]
MIFNLTDAQLAYMLKGTLATVELSVAGAVGGAIIGLPVALLLVSGRGIALRLGRAYVTVMQGIPLPVAMFVVYFGIGLFGFDVLPVIAASVALAVNAGAYLAEIWKGAILAVPATQWEAGESLALSYLQRMVHVILPQALRISVPPTVGFVVALIKNTSYAVVIGMSELTYTSRMVNNTTFEPFVIFTLAAGVYFILCYPVARMSVRLERMGRFGARLGKDSTQ